MTEEEYKQLMSDCGFSVAVHFANLNELDKGLDLMKISLNNIKE